MRRPGQASRAPSYRYLHAVDGRDEEIASARSDLAQHVDSRIGWKRTAVRISLYRRAARVRNTSCRCRPAMSGRVPGRRGEQPAQIGRSRRGHGGRPPASPGQGRLPRRRAGRTRQRPRPVSAGRPGLTPGTMRMLTRSSRRRSRGPRSPGPLRTEHCLIRTPTRRGGRPRRSRRMRPGAMPCLLDARSRRQAPLSGREICRFIVHGQAAPGGGQRVPR
jgi:hypothetical protein